MATLQTYLDNGTIWLDGFCYIAKASDGVEVQIGNLGKEKQLERYLIDHPTPNDWYERW